MKQAASLTVLALPLLAVALPGCGGCGSGSDGGATDAAATDAASADAGPDPRYLDGTPEPLDPGEIPPATLAVLATKFQPCHVHTGLDSWAVDVSYGWSLGSDLYVTTYDAGGDPIDPFPRTVAVPAVDLAATDWSGLPAMDPVTGEPLAYFVDVPGDNLGPGADEMDWNVEWEAIQGPFGDDPTTATFPPTHYVHAYWYDRGAQILALQYWFYYPYDKFVNNHEGDWEHITIVLGLAGTGAERFDASTDNQTPLVYHFSFHSSAGAWLPDEVVRVGDRTGAACGACNGDHVVVFSGGHACLTFPSGDTYCGDYSGASYPRPGTFPVEFGITQEDATGAGRLIHADEFAVVLLDEPGRVDYAANPTLSWLALPFFAGVPRVAVNDVLVMATGGDVAPTHPARKSNWLGGLPDPVVDITAGAPLVPFTPPADWPVITNPAP